MRVDQIEIHVGEPDFEFTTVRRLAAKCEAATAFSGAPTMDEVNAKLREMASGLGANAVIQVEYKSGMSMTSWRSMTGTGLAVTKVSDDTVCPSCAETIKRAAVKCRFCGTAISRDASEALQSSTGSAVARTSRRAPQFEEAPLRSTNNPVWWIFAVVGALILAGLLAGIS